MGAEKRNLEYLSPDDLIPYANNAKKHPKDQVLRISKSIKEFGFNAPVIIDSKNNIVAGHGRILAAKKLKLETVPCVRVDHLTEKQKKAYILADNRLTELGEWDLEILNTELQDIEYDLDIIGFDGWKVESHLKGLTDEDECPEIPKTPKSKLGDVWILGDHRLMCADSTDAEKVAVLMDGEKADMVFTDPPYGVSYAAKNKYLNTISRGNHIQKEIENDHMNVEDTSDFVFKAFCRIKENLAERSSYYITAPQGGDLMMMMMMMMKKAGIPLRHCLIWVKNNHVLGRTDYNYKHEPILFGWDKAHDFYGAGEHKFSTWEIPKPLKNDLHPTMKPIALIENACLNSTKEGQIVLDIFGGSGSTLIACEKTKRKCRVMEVDPHYCDVVVKRWEDYTGKRAEKING